MFYSIFVSAKISFPYRLISAIYFISAPYPIDRIRIGVGVGWCWFMTRCPNVYNSYWSLIWSWRLLNWCNEITAVLGLTLVLMKPGYSRELAPCHGSSRHQVIHIHDMSERQILVVHEEEFKPPTSSGWWEMIQNVNVAPYFLQVDSTRICMANIAIQGCIRCND